MMTFYEHDESYKSVALICTFRDDYQATEDGSSNNSNQVAIVSVFSF